VRASFGRSCDNSRTPPPPLASAAHAKADNVVAAALSARLEAQVGAGGRPEDLIGELDAEESQSASGSLRLAIYIVYGDSYALSNRNARSRCPRV
jgi:hypothetical protein